VIQFARVPASLMGAQDLSARDLRVLICIALHADTGGRSHPSLARIASLTGISRRHLCLSVRRLESGGYLRHRSHKSESGKWANSVYEITYPPIAASDGEPKQTIKRPQDGSVIAQMMLTVWREEYGDILPVPLKIDQSRASACQSRFHDSFNSDLEQWRSLCREIRRSAFCCGAGERGWRADFDWTLKPKSIRNIREGKYRDGTQPSNGRVSRWGRDEYVIYPLGPGGT